MPATSRKQQRAAWAALRAKRSNARSSLYGAAKQMAQSMSDKELEKFTHMAKMPKKG